MEDLYETKNSIYCYKDTNILKNNLEIKDLKKLQKIEARITAAKLLSLRQKSEAKEFSSETFIELHKYIFEDIYPFAGKLRTENIAKGNFAFADWRYIGEQLDNLMQELNSENYLIGMNKKDLSNRLSYYMSELNVLHPFREGNGRTIREFIRELALKNGYIFNLKKEEPSEMLEASIISVIDTDNLEKVIYNCLEINEKENKGN